MHALDKESKDEENPKIDLLEVMFPNLWYHISEWLSPLRWPFVTSIFPF